MRARVQLSGLDNKTTGESADAAPGWLPDGMSWENGVTCADVLGVKVIGGNAVAVEYSENMENLVIRLKGDKVYNHLNGTYRDDDLILIDPFEFYDADGKKLDVTIKNVYVNSGAALVAGASRERGSGNFVIVEFEGEVSGISSVVQRTTLRTDKVIANAGGI